MPLKSLKNKLSIIVGIAGTLVIIVFAGYFLSTAGNEASPETTIWVFSLLTAVSTALVILLIRVMLRPISHLVDVAEQWSLGIIQIPKKNDSQDEIGRLTAAFTAMADSLADITSTCQNIAVGDFSRKVTVRSDGDNLSKTVNLMVDNIRKIVKQLNRIADGGYSVNIQPLSDNDQLGHAISVMTRSLHQMTEESRIREVLSSGQMELNEKMRGEQDLPDLARNIVGFVCRHLRANIGAFYVVDPSNDDRLNLIGSYAYNSRKTLSNSFRFGESIVGQAALEKETITVRSIPPDYLTIQSGLGEASPANVVAIPLVLEERVNGVLEIGSFREITEADMAFLDQVARSIAIAVNSAISRSQMTALLQQTQEQTEMLHLQQKDLKLANAELEEQTKALKVSEAQLQAQQEELRQTNEELEEQTQLLEEQKEDIQRKNMELDKARRLIEEKAGALELSSKYKSEFLANMSHELRTPLNSILLLSRLLADNKENNLTPKQTEFASTIHSSGTDLLNLINEVLDLSKIEAGKMEVHPENVRTDDFLSALKRTFQPQTKEKAIEFIVNRTEGSPDCILTDRQRFEQIVKNFISNALKFTKQGTITVDISRPVSGTITLVENLKPDESIAVSVSDTGIGIPEKKQKLIFEAFQQADGTTSRKYGGTGLGLSISRELAKLLGGGIHMESREGEGSRFTLYLPEKMDLSRISANTGSASPVPSDNEKIEPKRLSSPAAPRNENGNFSERQMEQIRDDRNQILPGDKSILIIEDDPKFSKILRDLSREKGFKVLVAGDGETGLHFADYYQPSAVILDVGLPGMDGWTVMARLKEAPETRHIPVHFISASDKTLDAMKMGAIGYITKPVSMERLEQVYGKIERLISKHTKKLLIVEDSPAQSEAIIELLADDDVTISCASSGQQAYEQLKADDFDCMILDLGLPDMSGLELLTRLKNDEDLRGIPIIIYTGKELSKNEEITINEYAERIIIKGVKSPEKLLDETTLFLHRIESELPAEKRRMLQLIHDKESILKDKKILLVDDDMRNVYALSSILEEKGIKLIVGRNGKEGLRRLEEHPDTDLVLMDIMMPEMNGYEACTEIRKRDEFRNLPIIALTAKAMKGDRAKCIEAGANDYLAKPVDSDKLISILRVWLY